MSSATRTVRSLRLRADTAPAIQRAALLLADALRTATLPDAAGRIVVVRRLALGRIDSRGPPQTLALQLERCVAQLANECVHASSPSAAQAPAVWFRDALDAHLRLALKLAAGAATDAWYWPLAVKAWRPATPLLQALRQIVFSLAALAEARAAMPQWVAAMVGAGHAHSVVTALRIEDVAALAQAAGLRAPVPTSMGRRLHLQPRRAARASLQTSQEGAHEPAHGLGPAAANATPTADPRHALLKALLGAAGAEGVGASPQSSFGSIETPRTSFPAPAQRSKQQSPRSPERAAHDGRPSRTLSGQDAGADAALRSRLRHSETGSPPNGATAQRNRRADGAPDVLDASPLHEQDGGPRAHTEESWVLPAAGTQAGGLLFLVPVLERLGYREWLVAQPEWTRCDIARRVLAAVLSRLHIAEADPAWQLTHHRRAPRRAPGRFIPPPEWRRNLGLTSSRQRAARHADLCTLWDASGRLLLGAWSGACPRALMREWRNAERGSNPPFESDRIALVTRAWLTAARGWLRRFARIGVADLVLRPAAIVLTPTHSDVCFALGQAELRIRRTGLDIDPGWVPWFRRVVSFRYDG